MKYFLDRAKLNEIEEAYSTFGIDGLTTNPRHIAPANAEACSAIDISISPQ